MQTFNAIPMTACALALALAGAMTGSAVAQPPVAQPPAVQSPVVPPPDEMVEEVVVAGERAGPGLWKVRKGEHTLYLLATITPSPKKLEWRSREVETVLARAQAFVPARADVDVDIGPIKAVQLYLQYRKLRGNAEGERLDAVLPPPLFARFESLRGKYAPRDDSMLERRPILAVIDLQRAAIERSGLTFRDDVARKVQKLARERKVPVLRAEVKVDDPRGTLAEMGRIPLPAELACTEAILGRLETDLADSRRRAEAWSVGDVAGLRSGAATKAAGTCLDTLRSSARMSALLDGFESRWLGIVTGSLERNPVTLAIADIDALLRPGGLLAKLRARGYEIDEP